mmetsp:Transcript_19312/g.41745  ORF Transcript_19312/g.41745 Transcript_19312/m.41745 type:complete len:153 (+) Transcript_19312:1345-1803(+)
MHAGQLPICMTPPCHLHNPQSLSIHNLSLLHARKLLSLPQALVRCEQLHGNWSIHLPPGIRQQIHTHTYHIHAAPSCLHARHPAFFKATMEQPRLRLPTLPPSLVKFGKTKHQLGRRSEVVREWAARPPGVSESPADGTFSGGAWRHACTPA